MPGTVNNSWTPTVTPGKQQPLLENSSESYKTNTQHVETVIPIMTLSVKKCGQVASP